MLFATRKEKRRGNKIVFVLFAINDGKRVMVVKCGLTGADSLETNERIVHVLARKRGYCSAKEIQGEEMGERERERERGK